MRLGICGKLTGGRGFVLPVVLVIVIGILFVGLAAVQFSAQASKTAAGDRELAQARYAADTGIERIKVFLMADPKWSDGSVAEGPVDLTSEVEKVTVEHAVQDGRQVAIVTSTGRCHGVRKTVRVVMETGQVPLVSSFGGGLKILNPNSSAHPGDHRSITIYGSGIRFPVNTDLLVNGNIYIEGTPVIGNTSKRRTVCANGSIFTDLAYFKPCIYGDAYASGQVDPRFVAGQAVSNWSAPPLPDIEEVNKLVNMAREVALATERATGEKHYFASDKVFRSNDIKKLKRGVYFVEGNATIRDSVITDAQIAIVSAKNIYVDRTSWWGWWSSPYPVIDDENLTILAANDIVFQYTRMVNVALAVAGNAVEWWPASGGTASLRYGALVGSMFRCLHYDGYTALELAQNDNIDFGILAAPVHTAKIISHSEL
jgi:hypothetical protein